MYIYTYSDIHKYIYINILQFIKDMSERYTLAIWTSTRLQNAKNIIEKLFTSYNIPLLFQWFNGNCKRVSRSEFDSLYSLKVGGEGELYLCICVCLCTVYVRRVRERASVCV